MTTALETKPKSVKVDAGVSDPKAVVDGLSGILADTYRLLIKTHVVHWNVEGPLFFAIHTLTEEQYTALFQASDVIAERIRALGHLTPTSTKTLLADSTVKDAGKDLSAGHMVRALAEDHTAIAKRLHNLIKAAEEADDPVTADLATQRSTFHEKAAWMLRAITKE